MRIAIVTNIITPYRKRFYDEMFVQLKKRNDEFKVFAMTDSIPLHPWQFDKLKSTYMSLMPGYKMVFDMQDMDILYNPKINKYLKEFHPDIIIVAGSWTYLTTMHMLFFRIKGVKYLFWTESHEHRTGKTEIRSKGLLYLLKKNIYGKFYGFCIPGKYANESVTQIVGENGVRLRLPNLVDNEYYSKANEMRINKLELRDKYCVPRNKRAFITPSRLIPRKGIDLFLRQIVNMSENNESVFLLAGDGPLDSEIQQIADSGGLDVRLLGYCNQEMVRELYAASDIFLLPSLSDPNPLTVIEAAFAGLPLLVSEYTGNNPELCVNGLNGYVFETDKSQSVIASYKEIMSKDDKWLQSAGEKSYTLANDSFDCQNEVKKFIGQLNKI